MTIENRAIAERIPGCFPPASELDMEEALERHNNSIGQKPASDSTVLNCYRQAIERAPAPAFGQPLEEFFEAHKNNPYLKQIHKFLEAAKKDNRIRDMGDRPFVSSGGPLTYAVLAGRGWIVEELLSLGADPAENQYAALRWCKQPDMLAKFYEACKPLPENYNNAFLGFAVLANNGTLAKFCVEKMGADIKTSLAPLCNFLSLTPLPPECEEQEVFHPAQWAVSQKRGCLPVMAVHFCACEVLPLLFEKLGVERIKSVVSTSPSIDCEKTIKILNERDGISDEKRRDLFSRAMFKRKFNIAAALFTAASATLDLKSIIEEVISYVPESLNEVLKGGILEDITAARNWVQERNLLECHKGPLTFFLDVYEELALAKNIEEVQAILSKNNPKKPKKDFSGFLVVAAYTR